MWERIKTRVVGIKTDVATMKKSRAVHQKLKIEPPYEPAISFLDSYPKNKTKKKTPRSKKRCAHTHTFPHLTEHYLQQPRYGNCASVHQWMDE